MADAIIQGLDVSGELVNPKLQIQIAKLDNLGSTVIGLCETGGIRRVTLDPDFWDNVSETQRKLLVHHELGHCVLLRPHTSATGVIPDGLVVMASASRPIASSSPSAAAARSFRASSSSRPEGSSLRDRASRALFLAASLALRK